MAEIPDFPVDPAITTADLPIYILAERFVDRGNGTFSLEKPHLVWLTDSTKSKSLPIFTDLPAAEQWHKDHKLTLRIFAIDKAETLLGVAEAAKSNGVITVTRDPLREGLNVRTIPIDEFIDGIRRQMEIK